MNLASLLQDIATGTNTSQAKTYRMRGEEKVFYSAELVIHEVQCANCNAIGGITQNVLFDFARGEHKKHLRAAWKGQAKDILADNPTLPRNITRIRTMDDFCGECFLEGESNA